MSIKHIGILGGTFDPVHNGHISCAQFVQQYCQLTQVRLMPCHLPAHRATPGVSSQHRAAMVQLAINDKPELALEMLELNKTTPSFTVDSLQLLHARQPQCHYHFIIGMDSLCYFRSWKDWQHILQLANLLVCQRPGYSATQGDAPALLAEYEAGSVGQIHSRPGQILLLPNPQSDISASEIRQQLKLKQLPHESLNPAVLNYIQQQGLYLS